MECRKVIQASVRSVVSGNLRQLPHARHQRCGLRPFNQEHCTVVTIESKMNFFFLSSSSVRSGQFAASRTHFTYRTSQAHRFSRQAHGCSQFHHGLVEIARPGWAQQFLRSLPQLFLWKTFSGHALDHSLHISIDDRRWFVERNAGNCRRRVAADSGKSVRRSSALRGNLPACSSTISLAAACSMRARR